jgi:hypothetical protein
MDPMPRALRRFGFALLAALSLPLAACGGGGAQPRSPVQQDTSALQSRLTAGPWRLAQYVPNVSLEPSLAALLGAQIRTMTVTFDGQTLHAQSPTVNLTRPYQLQNVAGQAFDLVSPDMQGGGTLSSHCTVSDDGRSITFTAQTEPWNGAGVLEREGP